MKLKFSQLIVLYSQKWFSTLSMSFLIALASPTFVAAMKIAFQSDRGSHRGFNIYAVDIHGKGLVRLTNEGELNTGPCWSPDGTQIAFSSDRDGSLGIYVMNADGSHPTPLAKGAGGVNIAPVWSPDGGHIAFSSDRDGDFEIYVMNANGSNLTKLTQNAKRDEQISWSPDGGHIAFSSDRDGDFEIYVMNLDGTNTLQLTNNLARDDFPSWSPDGGHIAFSSDRSSHYFDVYIMNADGSNPVNLTQNKGKDDVLPSWQPTTLSVSAVEKSGTLWGAIKHSR